MKTGIRCFAGANTSAGFYSGFDGIFKSRDRTFFIKGAPGVGKSELMKRIAKRQQAMGHQVSIFHCSSDPDSFDGVADHTINAAIIDATPPHSYDPPLPGASGTILSLGDYLNESALSGDVSKIREITEEISAHFKSACLFLSAAKSMKDSVPVQINKRHAERAANEVLCMLPILPGIGSRRTFFLAAHTCKGYVSYKNQFPKDKTIGIPAPFGEIDDFPIRKIAEGARLRGLEAILFLNPIAPSKADGVYLPDAEIFVTIHPESVCARSYEDVYSQSAPDSDAHTLYQSLTQKAEAALMGAKTLHDELERFYTPRMDFSRLIEAESRVTLAFDKLSAK